MTLTRTRDVVVIAASAGGLEALCDLLSRLSPGFPAAVLVVLHVPPAGGQALPRILGRAGPLPAAAAADGEKFLPGHVYVAPPGHHMLIAAGQIRLSRGLRRGGYRPAADPLFISAALSEGPAAAAVVLSGTLGDGAAGCAAVERRGGLVLVQDPAESPYDGMPRAAVAATGHPQVLRLAALAAALEREARLPLPRGRLPPPEPGLERQLSTLLGAGDRAHPGTSSGFPASARGGPPAPSQRTTRRSGAE